MAGVVKTVREGSRDVAEAAGAVDGAAFREAMSRIAAAVHVVATDGPLGRAGATMTAVTSVSDRPPTLLVCVNRSSRLDTVLRGNGVFCVNTLVAGAESLAGVFAGQGRLGPEARFDHGDWRGGVTGAPVLVGARVALECRVTEIETVGSHSVVFGRVEAVHSGSTEAALLYMDRGYHVLAPGEPRG